MLYIPSRNQATVIPLYAPDPALGATVAYTHGAPEDQRLALRGAIRPEPRMPQGLPLLKPPYSRMTAIDLNTGEHAWWVPTGNGDPLPQPPAPAPPEPAAPRRRQRQQRPAPDEDAPHLLPDRRRHQQRPPPGRLRQDRRHGAGVNRSAVGRHRHADDVHGRWPAVHRADGRGRGRGWRRLRCRKVRAVSRVQVIPRFGDAVRRRQLASP